MMNHNITQKPARGFTLLELVVALGILTIVSTGVFVSIRSNDSNSERRHLQNASLALQADLRYAQRRAIMEGQPYRVVFEIINNRYQIQIDSTPRQTIRTVYLQNGVSILSTTIRNNQNAFLFYPRGTTSHAFTVILRTDSYQQELTVIPSGGRVEIKEIDPI